MARRSKPSKPVDRALEALTSVQFAYSSGEVSADAPTQGAVRRGAAEISPQTAALDARAVAPMHLHGPRKAPRVLSGVERLRVAMKVSRSVDIERLCDDAAREIEDLRERVGPASFPDNRAGSVHRYIH